MVTDKTNWRLACLKDKLEFKFFFWSLLMTQRLINDWLTEWQTKWLTGCLLIDREIDWLLADLNVAKCNLGKVNLEAMLVSSFPSYTRGGLMPLAGASRDLYTQLLACSSSKSVVAIACCLRAILCFGFFPSLTPSWGMGQVSIGR